MKIFDIVEGKSENRELWDRIKSKGVVPDFNRERYIDRSDQGLEGPFRLKNGKVVYYDPQEGSYYDPDTDMYIEYDDYKKMAEEAELPNKKPAGYYVMRNGQSISYHQDKESAEKRARAANMRGGSNATVVKDDRGVKEEADLDSYADALIKRNKQNLNKGHVVNAARIAGVDEKQLMAAVNKKVGRIKEEADLDKDVSVQIAELIRKKNSVSSPIARKNIDSQIAQLKKQRDKTKDVNEMDKSSNDYSGWGHSKHEVSNGPDKTAKMMKAKDAIKAARKTLDKAFDNSKKGVAEGSEIKIPTEDGIGWQDIRLLAGEGKLTQKTIKQAIEIIRKQRKQKQGMAEGDKRPDYVVKASSKPKKIKPSMGGESPHPYQGKLVGATEAEVSNTDYQWTHGKKPGGQGSWFFVAHRGGINFGKDVEGEDYVELHGMSYGDAKKAAVKWAKSKGHTSLFVAT